MFLQVSLELRSLLNYRIIITTFKKYEIFNTFKISQMLEIITKKLF